MNTILRFPFGRQTSPDQPGTVRHTSNRPWIVAASLGLVLLACGSLRAVPPAGTLQTPRAEASESGLALTVYNKGTALVQDRRRFDLSQGLNQISFADVAASIDPTSVLIRPLSNPGRTSILEQNYEFDLVGASALLEKYLDQQILVVTNDGKEYRGQLLSGRGDLVLQESGGRVTVIKLDNVQEFSFPELPQGLITKPTLVWLLRAGQAGPEDLEVTYLTGGLTWQSDYVLLLSADESTVDLDGWVTLTNTSGASFIDAQLKLIAGDLQRASDLGLAAQDLYMEDMLAAAEAPIDQREFFEYHLYEVPRPVSVRNNETKQIEFVSTADVPAEKFFVYDGLQCRSGYWYCYASSYPQTDPSYGVASNPKGMVMLEFDTEDVEADLPRGRVRVYQEDIDGAALLIGEDAIDHTPRGENLRLYIGDAFDIVGERVRTDFRRPTDKRLEEEYSITLRNHKDEAVEVRVVEHLSRWTEWRIFSSTAEYTKLDASTVEFRVRIPANGETQVSYGVRYIWP
ncbi:MAG TPA: DUF4139 domain-containing protein [Anaerolineales bacterium]|nr:DUF4139 domain-containing protein [Anaerolineales bacterium]